MGQHSAQFLIRSNIVRSRYPRAILLQYTQEESTVNKLIDLQNITKSFDNIVILDDNILSISKAILYGRTIFKSIRKFIIYQLTCFFQQNNIFFYLFSIDKVWKIIIINVFKADTAAII